MSFHQSPAGNAAPLPAVSPTSGGPSDSSTTEATERAKAATQPRRQSQRTQTLLGVKIAGSGSYVPDNVVTNEELSIRWGFDADWITQRTGILARRHAAPDQATSDLCVEAGRRAIRNAGVSPSEIDLLVVGTFTPDFASCPSTACLVQDRLGLDVPAFDTSAACAGFMYALVTAAQYVATGNSRMALVVGGDCNSRIIDPKDQKTFPLFGDGAGAVVLTQGDAHQGLLCYQLGADGSGGPLLERPNGGTRRPLSEHDLFQGRQYLHMDGRNVFKWAVTLLADSIELVLHRSGLTVDDVSLFVLHQANVRIINAAMEHLGVPASKVFLNLQKYGNTSGGSIPIALDEALQAGRIQRGDHVVFSGFGAGLAWGTGVMRW